MLVAHSSRARPPFGGESETARSLGELSGIRRSHDRCLTYARSRLFEQRLPINETLKLSGRGNNRNELGALTSEYVLGNACAGAGRVRLTAASLRTARR